MSKADVVAVQGTSPPTLLANSPPSSAAAEAPVDQPTRLSQQARRSSWAASRASTLLSSALNLRGRGASQSEALDDDWARPVGGSDGLGTIYGSSMNQRERSQVLRSVTTLAKTGTDSQGNYAEAAPEPSLFARRPSATPGNRRSSFLGLQKGPPPSYQQHQSAGARRGSEGSIANWPYGQARQQPFQDAREIDTGRRASDNSSDHVGRISSRSSSSRSNTSVSPGGFARRPRNSEQARPSLPSPSLSFLSSLGRGASNVMSSRTGSNRESNEVSPATTSTNSLSATSTVDSGTRSNGTSHPSSVVESSESGGGAGAVVSFSSGVDGDPQASGKPRRISAGEPAQEQQQRQLERGFNSSQQQLQPESRLDQSPESAAVTAEAAAAAVQTGRASNSLRDPHCQAASADSAAHASPSPDSIRTPRQQPHLSPPPSPTAPNIPNTDTPPAVRPSKRSSPSPASGDSTQVTTTATSTSSNSFTPTAPCSNIVKTTTRPSDGFADVDNDRIAPLSPPYSTSSSCLSPVLGSPKAGSLTAGPPNRISIVEPPSPPQSSHGPSTEGPSQKLSREPSAAAQGASQGRSSARVSFDVSCNNSDAQMQTMRRSSAGVHQDAKESQLNANLPRRSSAAKPESEGRSSFSWLRVGLPGSPHSRRGSADADTPGQTPSPKCKGKSNSSSSIGKNSLKSTMKKWASASSEVLSLPNGPGSSSSRRGSMSVDPSDTIPGRKSIHFPASSRNNDESEEMETLNDPLATANLSSPNSSSTNAETSPTRTRSSFSLPRPSMDSAVRPSFNFLRRASDALSSHEGQAESQGPRSRKASTSSFAKGFVMKTLGRSRKSSNAYIDPLERRPSEADNSGLAPPEFSTDGVDPLQSASPPAGAAAHVNGVAPPSSQSTSSPKARETFTAQATSSSDSSPSTIPPYPGTQPRLPAFGFQESGPIWTDSFLSSDPNISRSNGGSVSADQTCVSSDTALSADLSKKPNDQLSLADDSLSSQPTSMDALLQRRPSLGIDQEQDALQPAAAPPAPVSVETDTTLTRASTGGASNGVEEAPEPSDSATAPSSQQPSRRASRSSKALSHLPRLNSMRINRNNTQGDVGAVGGGSSRGVESSGGDEGGSDGHDDAAHTSDEEQEESEEDEEERSSADGDDVESETDGETDDPGTADESYASARSTSPPGSAPMSNSSSSAGINRNRPAQTIVLPPAPTFIPAATSAASSSTTLNARSSPTPTYESLAADGFKVSVGRESWTSFNSNVTPFETPTPGIGSAYPTRTPRARNQELSESSYFAHRPGSSRPSTAGTGSMSGEAPPPSPSIITRSRAPSSASARTVRLPMTPGSNTSMVPPPAPNREVPQIHVASLTPLGLDRKARRQSQTRQGPSSRTTSPATSTSPLPAGPSSRSTTPGLVAPGSKPFGDVESQNGSLGRADSTSRHEGMSPRVTMTVKERESVIRPGSRPALYQQKSKSLVDLSSPAARFLELENAVPASPTSSIHASASQSRPNDKQALRIDVTDSSLKAPVPADANSIRLGVAPPSAGLVPPPTPGLNRRRSMFEIRAEPPPYSIIHRRPEGPQIIFPREEEGREKLPAYYCGVHIEGYLPRKMEFSAPGVQAKDRSWKRQYFVLHGTSLRVYKQDLSTEKYATNGAWGQMKGVHVHLEPMNEDGSSSGGGSSLGLGQAAREAIAHTPFGHHGGSGGSNVSSSDFDTKNGLVRNYTLQGAESGLAADYLKRRHVVRVRAEGEQFLLQTRSDRHVVDWIEALQAATNIAMDLEKRPMPKFITLPRRRRRRRRNPDGTTMTAAEQEARDIAEAQRRSMMEAGESSGRGASSRAPRPSNSIENDLNPSAAFEEMLREEHEESTRHAAADI